MYYVFKQGLHCHITRTTTANPVAPRMKPKYFQTVNVDNDIRQKFEQKVLIAYILA